MQSQDTQKDSIFCFTPETSARTFLLLKKLWILAWKHGKDKIDS